MGRKSFKVRGARLIQRLPLSWLRIFERTVMNAGSGVNKRPQVIILLALPRSGSTLMYQTMIHTLKPLYLSNLWNTFYSLPWVGGKISQHLCNDHQSDFRSRHGFVDGVCGPAEGMRFWSYWIGNGINEIQSMRIDQQKLIGRKEYLGSVLSRLTRPNFPMVTGYVGHILAVEPLRELFPDAIFIRLHRDPLSNAASILRSRQVEGDGWFSVMPKECEAVQYSTIHRQVASQVYWLNRRLAVLRDDPSTVHVHYEKLCRNPGHELNRLVAFCNERGMRLAAQDSLPNKFEFRMVRETDDYDAAILASEYRRLSLRSKPS